MSEASSAENPYLIGMEKMRFLYCSISADHASSLPCRHSFTKRISGHASFNSSRVEILGGAMAVARFARLSVDVELFNVPQRVRIENRRPEISDAILGPCQDVGARQTDHRQILGNDLLNPIVQASSLPIIQGDQLLVHQAIHLRFPRRRRLGLLEVPQMSLPAGDPNVHL